MKTQRVAPIGIGAGLPGHKAAGKAAPHPLAGRHLSVSRSARRAARPGPRSVASLVCSADLLGFASTIPTVATSVAVVCGALLLSQNNGHAGKVGKPCPTCGGSGMEVCFCNRWSDGDAGCQSCNHTGYMKCRSCGGGGTAVPIAISVRKDDSAGSPL